MTDSTISCCDRCAALLSLPRQWMISRSLESYACMLCGRHLVLSEYYVDGLIWNFNSEKSYLDGLCGSTP